MLLAKISSDLIAKFKSFFSIHLLKLDRVGHHLFSGKDGSPTTLFYITHLFELLFCSNAALDYFPDFSHLSSCPNLQIWYHTHVCLSVRFISTPHLTPEFWFYTTCQALHWWVVQWLGCHTATAGGTGSINNERTTRIPHGALSRPKKDKIKNSVYLVSSYQVKCIQNWNNLPPPHHSILLPTLSQLMASIIIQDKKKKKKITHVFFLSRPSPYHWLGFVSQTYPSPPSPPRVTAEGTALFLP